MHRYIFSQLKCCRSRFTTSKQILTSNPTARNFSNNKSEKNILSQTTILVQQGCDIQELPVIMRRIDHDDMVALCSNASSVNEIIGRRVGGDISKVNSSVDPDVVIEQLDECVSHKGVLSVIYDIPEGELTPDVALVAFNTLVHLGSLIELRNLEDTNEIYGKIIDCIATKSDTKILLDTLTTSVDLKKTSQRICDELLVRNSDGMLGIVEICESVQKFVECHQYEGAEKFWSGLADQDKHINANNIKFIYQILPKLKVSRRMVVGLAERKITGVFWNLSSEAVTDILKALVASKQTSYRTLQSITRWLNTNIHAVNESDLESIVKSSTMLEYSDGQMEKALERYIKTKGIKVRNQSLISTILSHCASFRIRNPHIMNGCSEYFITHAGDIKSEYLKSIFCPFGLLDYQPINSAKFWQTFENCLHLNFDNISARDVVDIALSCLYLEKFPINFIQRIFNPYFLDLLHTTTPLVEHPKLRSDLKLFDTGMSIECDSYNGPMLPKDHSVKHVWQDGRIKRIVQNLTDQWVIISGGPDKFTKCTAPQQLPLNSLYLIDLLIHPAGMGRLWNFNTHTDRNLYIATLIHLPEHYDATKQHLIGPQSMRIRHFRQLGLKVVTLDYETLAKLRVHGNELHKYLVERMRQALSATGYRVIKSPAEIEVLRYVAKVSSDAHKKVMKAMKPGLYEYQAEAVFLQHSYFAGGCRHASYTCICGSGENSAILHYGHAGAPNEKIIRDGEMLLFDMGANYFGYAADITCSYPSNGKFTDDQITIYNAVLAANLAVQNNARDGVSWVDMHKLANKVMLTELRTAGLVVGEIDDMMAAGINGVFQPHGLGHLLGLDVHDVGAFLPHCPPRSTELGLEPLRMSRNLKAGMYVTIEPGCYFIDHLLNKALADPVQRKFLVSEVIARFRNFGGVRIEDDVLITATGVENFAIVPRTVDEIEEFMRS